MSTVMRIKIGKSYVGLNSPASLDMRQAQPQAEGEVFNSTGTDGHYLVHIDEMNVLIRRCPQLNLWIYKGIIDVDNKVVTFQYAYIHPVSRVIS